MDVATDSENEMPVPSFGSIGHQSGGCRNAPCAFFYLGACSKNRVCEHCHGEHVEGDFDQKVLRYARWAKRDAIATLKVAIAAVTSSSSSTAPPSTAPSEHAKQTTTTLPSDFKLDEMD